MTLLAFRLGQPGCGLKARPGWPGQAAAVKQSPAVEAAASGAGSCSRPMAACVKLSEVLSYQGASGSGVSASSQISEIQMYYCEAGAAGRWQKEHSQKTVAASAGASGGEWR